MAQDRPAKNYSVKELLAMKETCNNFIKQAQRKISGQGGWIAREANEYEISKAQADINIIDKELALR